ncbi:hypothetical protein, partial [Escherichia coli]|uniref:hypothetical protein n=1 Tax=Escherichia coli TaxID=562 RepID=UPI003EE2CCBA
TNQSLCCFPIQFIFKQHFTKHFLSLTHFESFIVAMSQFSEGSKKPLFPMHLMLAGGTVLYISVCLD